jgi:uncharacterized protein (TIGR02145 family)
MKKILLPLLTATLLFAGCKKIVEDPTETDGGVMINGVTWATRNVDKPGKFAATPEATGMFYRWNSKTAWLSAGYEDPVSYPAGATWKDGLQPGSVWESANDPCPAGWRVPTKEELTTLLDVNNVTGIWTTKSGINGYKFTDKASKNSVFLPATGGLDAGGWLGVSGFFAFYYSNSSGLRGSAWYLYIDSDGPVVDMDDNVYGRPIRCVRQG